MKKRTPETDEEREERKAQFIARATAHFDSPQIRKEASDKWEESNKKE
jgi:hypothetical protein